MSRKSSVLILGEDNLVYVCGSNRCGLLPTGDKISRRKLRPIQLPCRLVSVSSLGKYRTFGLGICDDGHLWVWGTYRYFRKRSFGFENRSVAFIGEILAKDLSFNRFNHPSHFIQVSVAYSVVLLLDSEGVVWKLGSHWQHFGKTDDDIPGAIESLVDIISIESGNWFSIALDRKGSLWSFGINMRHSLGLGDQLPSQEFPRVGLPSFPGHPLYKDCWVAVPMMIPIVENVIKVSCGSFHTFALDSDGGVWSFGCGDLGQLGNGNFEDRAVPELVIDRNDEMFPATDILCSDRKSLVKGHDFRTFVCGSNDFDQLGKHPHQPKAINILTWQSEWDGKQVIFERTFTIIIDEKGAATAVGNYSDTVCKHLGTIAHPRETPRIKSALKS